MHAYEPLVVYEGTRSGFTFPMDIGWDPRAEEAYNGEDLTVFSAIGGQESDSIIPLVGTLMPNNPEKIRYLATPAGYVNPHLWAWNWGIANAA